MAGHDSPQLHAAAVTFSMPASVTVIRPHGDIDAGPAGLVFFSDQAGAVPVAMTWTQVQLP